MAGHAAAFCLLDTIKGILEASRFSVDLRSEEILGITFLTLPPLIEILARLDKTRKNRSREKINDVDRRIKEEVWRFEDLLESHVTDQIHSQSETHQDQLFSIDLQVLEHDLDSFIRTVERLEQEYIYELENMPEEEAEEEERIGFGGKKSKMIGLSDEFQDVKSFLVKEHIPTCIHGISGMAGIGKTTLAEEIFEDPEIERHFEHRVWVRVGRRSRSSEYYARAVLSQLDPYYDGQEKEICKHLKERLEDKRCLVVLDDVWEAEVLKSLLSFLPEGEKLMTKILLTIRDLNVLVEIGKMDSITISGKGVRFMNEEESKDLLCMKVFGEEGSLPSKLEKAAKKIAKKCEGLPLLIVAVAERLSEGNMTEEYWNEVAEERNSVFQDALEEISKVLFPSYDYLPHYLKIFFLYLGVFHPDCESPRPTSIICWPVRGGFLT